MRLSIDRNDPGYKSDVECARYRVFFNGQQMFDCHTADEEQGYVKRLIRHTRPAPWLPVSTKVGPVLRGTVQILPK